MITRNLRYSILIPVREQCNSTFSNPELCLTIFKTSVIFCANCPTIFSRNHFRPLIPSTHSNPNFSLPDLVSILSSLLVLEKDGDGQGRRTLEEQGYRFPSFIVNPFCSSITFLLPFKQCSTISFSVPVRNFCVLQWVTLSHIWFKSVGCGYKRN